MQPSRQSHLFKLHDRAYAKLRKVVIEHLKKDDAVLADLFSISADTPEHKQIAASDIFQKVLLDILLHAVLDDDRKITQTILNAYPELLLIKPPADLVIESQLTWQKFYAEEALKIAVKRRQVKMIKLLLPYYDKLEQTEDVIKAKVDALSFWEDYKIKKNAQGEDEIVIPQEYTNYVKSLIDAFSKEPCYLDDIGNVDPTKLKEKTESELSSLLNILLPKQAVKLDNYLDVELLLLAVYKAYRDDDVLNCNQQEAFCIRVIGLIQSTLAPETAKIFCESLDEMVKAKKQGKNIEISKKAMSYKLRTGESFYRKSRNDFSDGVGSKFFCGIFTGGSSLWWRALEHRHLAMMLKNERKAAGILEYLCQRKTSSFEKFLRRRKITPKTELVPNCNRLK